jgi:hypothetical protein
MNNKLFLGLSILIFSVFSWSAPSFRVLKVYGTNSLIDEKNEAKVLTQGVFLPTNAKVMVSKGSQLTLTSDTGALMHLSEGSVLEIWREQLVLLSGTLWVQSPSEEKEQNIETMNGVINYKKTEFVLSFDDINKKTQAFVISGHASIANIFMKEKKELLVSGEISFIQKDFQQGMPRRAALIGNESLATVFNKFKGIKPGDENFQSIISQNNSGKEREDFTVSKGGRGIASTTEAGSVGGIYFLPKSFSAPKRFHSLKPKVMKRSIASSEVHKRSPSQSAQGNYNLKPVRVFELFRHTPKNTWTSILGEGESSVESKKSLRVPASMTTHKKHVEQHVEHHKKSEEVSPDFDSLMKDLKNVSPDHNEVY